MREYNKLVSYIDCGKVKKVIKVLSQNSTIDVKYKDGKLFLSAIESDNATIAQVLINFFENKQYPQKDETYVKARESLSQILKNTISGEEISSEMQEVLSPYLSTKDTKSEVLEDEYSLGSIDSNYKTEYSPKETLSVSDELPNKFTIRDKKLIHEKNISTAASENISLFFNTPKIDVCNDDFSIDYGNYLSQQITDTCLGNSDISTRENTPEKEVNCTGDIDTNTTEFEG